MIDGLGWARLVVVGLLTTAVAATTAHAARVAIQVPHVDSESTVSDGRRNKFHDTLAAGLKEAAGTDTTLVTAEEVRFALGDRPELLGCSEGTCLRQVAELLKVDRLIVATIGIKSAVGGSAYKIGLHVYDRSGTALPIVGSESCGDDSDGCNLARAFDALKRSTASIASQLSKPTVPERIQTQSDERAAEAKAAQAKPAAPDLTLKDPTTPEAAPQPSPYAKVYRYGWIAAAAATGAFVIGSIPFLVFAARENQITCAAGTPRNQCPTVYTGNLGPGLGLLLGGGLISAGAFAVLFYLDRREQKRMSGARHAILELPLVHVGSDGLALSLGGHF